MTDEKSSSAQMKQAMNAIRDAAPALEPFMAIKGGKTRSGEPISIHFNDEIMHVLVHAEDTGGMFGVISAEIPVGSGPPPHIQTLEDKLFYVIVGKILLKTNKGDFEASAGSALFVPRGTMHYFKVIGDETAQILMILAPGGHERIFRAWGKEATSLGLPEQPEFSTMEEIISVGEEFGVDVQPDYQDWMKIKHSEWAAKMGPG
jgi:quercetin dioxygenase-like cupin family protein